MGRVFSPHAVQQGRVPTLSQISDVVNLIKKELLPAPTVRVAVVCGSVIRGDHNRRSDLDLLLIHRSSGEQPVWNLLHRIDAQAERFSVQVGFIPVHITEAHCQTHTIGPAFRAHIDAAVAAGGTIKGDLRRYLAPAVITVQAEARAYLSRKSYSLQAGLAGYESMTLEQRFRFLQKIVESPLHIARRVLQYHGAFVGDSKREVIEQYRSFATVHRVRQFDDLLAVDEQYTTALETALQDYVAVDYLQAVGQLIAARAGAVEFARLNALLVA